MKNFFFIIVLFWNVFFDTFSQDNVKNDQGYQDLSIFLTLPPETQNLITQYLIPTLLPESESPVWSGYYSGKYIEYEDHRIGVVSIYVKNKKGYSLKSALFSDCHLYGCALAPSAEFVCLLLQYPNRFPYPAYEIKICEIKSMKIKRTIDITQLLTDNKFPIIKNKMIQIAFCEPNMIALATDGSILLYDITKNISGSIHNDKTNNATSQLSSLVFNSTGNRLAVRYDNGYIDGYFLTQNEKGIKATPFNKNLNFHEWIKCLPIRPKD